MSFNPLLTRSGDGSLIPLCDQTERLILKREKTSIKLTIDKNKHSGNGTTYLTSRRVVFVKEGDVAKHKNWSSVEFPYTLVYNPDKAGELPEFKQPVFGSNFLYFGCKPSEGADYAFSTDGEVNLSFRDSCYTFIKLFFTMMKSASGQTTGTDVQRLLGTGQEVQAFIDQSDPSTIYFAQPPAGPLQNLAPPQGVSLRNGYQALPQDNPPAMQPQQMYPPPPYQVQHGYYQQPPPAAGFPGYPGGGYPGGGHPGGGYPGGGYPGGGYPGGGYPGGGYPGGAYQPVTGPNFQTNFQAGPGAYNGAATGQSQPPGNYSGFRPSGGYDGPQGYAVPQRYYQPPVYEHGPAATVQQDGGYHNNEQGARAEGAPQQAGGVHPTSQTTATFNGGQPPVLREDKKQFYTLQRFHVYHVM